MSFQRLLLPVILFIPVVLFPQSRTPKIILSDSAKISLITASPGWELYTRWGHSAIRVNDPQHRIDLVYNYGTFDFNEPGFYVKFLRGRLLYFLDAYDFKYEVPAYKKMNQTLFEQNLNLNQQEKQEVFNFLLNNVKPENRFYLYDFFFDNCSTRIRDVFKSVLGNKLRFPDYANDNKTFRQMADADLSTAPWEKFGIDLILGLPTDKIASSWDRMFLPRDLMESFAHAEIKKDSTIIPLAEPAHILYQRLPLTEKIGLLTPSFVFWGLFVIVLLFTFFQFIRNFRFVWPDVIVFGISGILGLAILFMWFGTDHYATKENFNFLWSLPLNILIPYFLIKNQNNLYLRSYLISIVVINIILILSWKIFPQQYNVSDIPILLIFIVRGVYLVLNKRHIKTATVLKT